MYQDRRQRRPSLLGFAGGVLAAAAIALSAWAAHSPELAAKGSLQTASLYAFGHGVALAALAGNAHRLLPRVALYVLLVGTLLFCGSLAAGALAGASTRAAPAGGVAMIAGWLLFAFNALRR